MGPLWWVFVAMAIGGPMNLVDPIATGMDSAGAIVQSVVGVVIGVWAVVLIRSRLEIVGDELRVINGARTHRIPRSAIVEVRFGGRHYAQPLEVLRTEGRPVVVLGCASLPFRQAPGMAAYRRRNRPYEELAETVDRWAATGRVVTAGRTEP